MSCYYCGKELRHESDSEEIKPEFEGFEEDVAQVSEASSTSDNVEAVNEAEVQAEKPENPAFLLIAIWILMGFCYTRAIPNGETIFLYTLIGAILGKMLTID